MLAYEIKTIPDLTLSKYQVFEESGIEGMLDAQAQFIRQLYRAALLGNVNIHFYLIMLRSVLKVIKLISDCYLLVLRKMKSILIK